MKESDELRWHKRVTAAQDTSRLVQAVKYLEATDFETMMGSGVMVSLLPITAGRTSCEEFMLNAEDLQSIKVSIIDSLRKQLKFRLSIRSLEINAISTLLGEPDDSETA